MKYSTLSSPIQVLWSGVYVKTLDTSYSTSDAIEIGFAKRVTIFPYYSAGTGAVTGKLDIAVELNPFDGPSDTAGAYWAQVGNFTDSSGTWSEEPASYQEGQGTVNVYKAGTPITLSNIDALQMRIKIKELNPGVAGLAKLVVVKNEIT